MVAGARASGGRFDADVALPTTPTWLMTAALTAGHSLLAADSPRIQYLGRHPTLTPAVAAACHPQTAVVAWNDSPDALEQLERLRADADLDNLQVSRARRSPVESASGPYDMIVIEGVLDAADPQLRDDTFDAVASSLRPGGLVAISYRTTIGWPEFAPVIALLRRLVGNNPRPTSASIADALERIAALRAADVGYLVERPSVAEWWDTLVGSSPDQIAERYLTTPLAPLSHDTLVGAMASIGCTYIGTAQSGSFAPDLPGTTAASIDGTPHPAAREAMTDIALRRTQRCDLFRSGGRPLSNERRTHSLSSVELVSVVGPERLRDAARGVDIDAELIAGLSRGPVAVSSLAGTPSRVDDVLRRLLDTGSVWPVNPDAGSAESAAAATRLTHAISANAVQGGRARFVAPLVGTAISDDPAPPTDLCELLGGTPG